MIALESKDDAVAKQHSGNTKTVKPAHILHTVSGFPSPFRQSEDLFKRSYNAIRTKYRALRNHA